MLDVGEAAQVRADLREDLHHHSQPQTVDAREIGTGPIGQYLARGVLPRSIQIGLGNAKLTQQSLQLGVALAQVSGNVIIHHQRLAQYEQV